MVLGVWIFGDLVFEFLCCEVAEFGFGINSFSCTAAFIRCQLKISEEKCLFLLGLGGPGFGDSCSKRQNGPVEFTVPSAISAGFSTSALGW